MPRNSERRCRHGHAARDEQFAFGEYSVEWGRQWAADRLSKVGLKNVAVLAGNDEIALGIMQTAQDAGISVPKDFRIVGFDDTRIATLVRPALSTVRVPLLDIGAAVVRLLVERVGNSEKPATREKLPTKLIVRESSRV